MLKKLSLIALVATATMTLSGCGKGTSGDQGSKADANGSSVAAAPATTDKSAASSSSTSTPPAAAPTEQTPAPADNSAAAPAEQTPAPADNSAAPAAPTDANATQAPAAATT